MSSPPRTSTLARATRLLASCESARASAEAQARAIRRAHSDVVEREALVALEEVPVSALRDHLPLGVDLGPLETVGVNSVADVLRRKVTGLTRIIGINTKTAEAIWSAARTVRFAVGRDVEIVLDDEERPAAHTDLVVAVATYDDLVFGRQDELEEIDQIILRLRTLLPQIERSGRRWRPSEEAEAMDKLADIIGDVSPEAKRVLAAANEAHDPDEAWGRHLADLTLVRRVVADVLGEDGTKRSGRAAQGLMSAVDAVGLGEVVPPEEILAAMTRTDLRLGGLTATLREYQRLATSFAVTQKRVVIGDEMGLGKTLEAMGAVVHVLDGEGTHAIVICPAAVVANWDHEFRRHSHLRPVRLHGPDREENRRRWIDDGGVAITTYDTFRQEPIDEVAPSITVVDEAHYIKNPDALRTQAVGELIERSAHALLLTGTPLENRLSEFQTLISHVRPRIGDSLNADPSVLTPARCRDLVAPAYLRRNQRDVLDEIPERIEVDQWVVLSEEDLDAYREALLLENFQALRRSPYMAKHPAESAKLQRLQELVAEAAERGRRVVVFSQFLSVLDKVTQALGTAVVGRISGAVPTDKRQQLLDDFASAETPAVLVSQIDAGGVGLNIQAASTVILCEPQWKPSTEQQAIARCHRMGQEDRVEVHRLLAEETVDERMLDLIADKAALFADYVDGSAMGDMTAVSGGGAAGGPEAERLIIEMERKRVLGDDVSLARTRE